MAIPGSTLKNISDDIIAILRELPADAISEMISMIDYHGFWKTRLPDTFLRSILSPHGLSSDDVQIEIVKVDTDLTREVHFHAHAHAMIYALGQREGLANASRALAYRHNTWQDIQSGEEVDIPPGTPHGFSVKPEGELWFLSVQAPPIVGEGSDDYHQVTSEVMA
jgi:mannose-6-phosphate isomerase-like protein (cupin superfamily)